MVTLEHVGLVGNRPAGYGGEWEDGFVLLAALLDGADVSEHRGTAFEAAATERWRHAVTTADERWPMIAAEPESGTVALHATHAYAAAPSDVWSAITQPDRLTAWFGRASGEFALGGTWTLTWDTGAASGTVTECEPNERLVTTWRWDFEPDAPESSVTVELVGLAGGGTLVTVAQRDCTAPGTGCGAGWYAHLNGLDRHLSGAPIVEADWQAARELAMTMLRP